MKPTTNRLDDLQRRWQAKSNGQPIPRDILLQPLSVIDKAVRLLEAGIVPVIPPVRCAVPADDFGGSSMVEWDRASEF